jgi:hypothetical protein
MNRVIHCGRTVARRLLRKGEVCLTSEMDLEVKSVGGSSVQYSAAHSVVIPCLSHMWRRIHRHIRRQIRRRTRRRLSSANFWAKSCSSFSAALHLLDPLVVKMVYVSKSAIQCPSKSCGFAYFASSPDPAGKLRSHFNNFKIRDVEHDAFFQNPFCVFCGNAIMFKTRKGLWKSDINKHWLITHSAEFVEAVEQHGKQEMVSSKAFRMIHDWINNSAGDYSPSLAIRIGKAIARMAARIRIGRRRFDRSKRKDDTSESWHGNCKKYIERRFGTDTKTQKNSLRAVAIWLVGNTLGKPHGADNISVQASSSAEPSPAGRLTEESG